MNLHQIGKKLHLQLKTQNFLQISNNKLIHLIYIFNWMYKKQLQNFFINNMYFYNVSFKKIPEKEGKKIEVDNNPIWTHYSLIVNIFNSLFYIKKMVTATVDKHAGDFSNKRWKSNWF